MSCSKWCYRVTGFLYTRLSACICKSSLVADLFRRGWIQRGIAHERMTLILWKCLLHSLFKAAMLAHQAQMGKMILCVLGAKSGTCFHRGRWDLTDSECLLGDVRIIQSRRSIYVLFMRLSPSCDLYIIMAPNWSSLVVLVDNFLIGVRTRRYEV